MTLSASTIDTFDVRPWALAGAGLAIPLLLASPPLRLLLEGHLVAHLLVQLPLLALAGVLAGRALLAFQRERGSDAESPISWNAHGRPGLLLALFAAAFWMLPRSLDAALAEPVMAAAKFVSLPLLLGLPLALSWPRLHPIARGFVWTNLLSMLGFLGWLYLAAPTRLCNFYLQDEQALLGHALLGIGAGLALYLTARAFMGRSREAIAA